MVGYDPATALIVVDVQNDFADPGGALSVSGGAAAIPFINEQVAGTLGAGGLVVYTQDWHPEDTPHFEKDGGIWPVHCVGDSWGAQLHPDLKVEGDRIHKGSGGEDGYSGFTVRDPESGAASPTELESLLRECDIERVVIVGLATDYCVKETAIDSVGLGFETTVLTGGIRAVDLQPGDGEQAVAAMAEAGVTVA